MALSSLGAGPASAQVADPVQPLEEAASPLQTPAEVPAPDSDAEALFALEKELNASVQTTVASRAPEALLETPGTVYVITAEDIARHGWRELREVLQSVPNLDLSWQWNWLTGGQRGFTGNFSGTLLLLDGREIQGLLAGETFITSAFSTHKIKRIEILQGPNSTLYGANALQGVINIVTNYGPDGDDGAMAQYIVGEVGLNQLDAEARVSKSDFTIGASLHFFHSDQSYARLADFQANTQDYSRAPGLDRVRSSDPAQFKIPETSYAFDLNARYRWFYAGANYFRTVNTEGLEAVNFDYKGHEARRGMLQLYAGGKVDLTSHLQALVEYRDLHEEDSWIIQTPLNLDSATSYADLQLPLALTFNDIRRHRVFSQFSYDFGHWSRLIGGYDFIRTVYLQSTDDGVLDATNILPGEYDSSLGNANTSENAGYLEDTATFFEGRLRAVVGGRLAQVGHAGTALLPRASVSYLPSKLAAIKLSYGEGYRGPTIFELNYAKGVDHVPPLRMRMLEANYTQQLVFPKLGVGLTNTLAAYRMVQQNVYDNLSLENGDVLTVVNERAFGVNGAEDEVRFTFRGNLNGFVTARWVQPDRTVVAGQSIVADVPQLQTNVGVSYQMTPYFLASLFMTHWGRVQTDANTPDGSSVEVYTVPQWTTLNGYLQAGDFKLQEMKVHAGVYCENIFNTVYYHADVRGASPVQYIQAPRNFRLQLAVAY